MGSDYATWVVHLSPRKTDGRKHCERPVKRLCDGRMRTVRSPPLASCRWCERQRTPRSALWAPRARVRVSITQRALCKSVKKNPTKREKKKENKKMKNTNFDSYYYGAKRIDSSSFLFDVFGKSAGIRRTSKNHYEFVAVMPWRIYVQCFPTFRAAWGYVWGEFYEEYKKYTEEVKN